MGLPGASKPQADAVVTPIGGQRGPATRIGLAHHRERQGGVAHAHGVRAEARHGAKGGQRESPQSLRTEREQESKRESVRIKAPACRIDPFDP